MTNRRESDSQNLGELIVFFEEKTCSNANRICFMINFIRWLLVDWVEVLFFSLKASNHKFGVHYVGASHSINLIAISYDETIRTLQVSIEIVNMSEV